MKKIISILLACLLMIGSALTASAAVAERTFSFDVSAQGDYADPHNIVAEAGSTITVAYRLTVDSEEGATALTQNEINYDSAFFTFVEGSITLDSQYGGGMSYSNKQRLNGEWFVFFNNGSSKGFSDGVGDNPSVIGTFKLVVKSNAKGTSLVNSRNYGAVSTGNVSYKTTATDLKVTVAGTAATVPVAGVTLNKSYSTLQIDNKEQLGAAVSPADASNKNVTWSSSNEAVATVDAKGNVNAKSAGTATITATTADGGKTASCTVTVTANAEETTPETPAEIPQTPAEETPVEETVPETPGIAFTDVKKSNYFYDAVLWAVENEITLGKTATLFDPSGSITRAQAVTFLWRAAGCPVVNYAMSFTDVKAGAYYAEAVRWAVAEGITNGTTSSTFSPNATCTRGQIVSFLYRYAKASPVGTGNPFTDVAAGAYYYDAVLWAVSKGITGGTTASTFAPKNTCSRAQVVTFLYRYMGK